MKQTTLKAPIQCSGIGLHTGIDVNMTLKPSDANTGIVFKRMDVERKKSLVVARYDGVTETRLGTTICNKQGVSVSTIEHLMAALAGLGVDNALIELDGPEVPIMDGSSEPFIALIEKAGIAHLAAPRRVLRIVKSVEIQEGESIASVEPYDGEEGGYSIDITIDFNHKLIRRQRALYDFSNVSFRDALSRARTFGFEHEVEYLRKNGLALGGSLDNAIVVGEERILNEEGLRFEDEFIRHKALDCVGDLALAGLRIEGAFNFTRPGHGINNKLLRAIMADPHAYTIARLDDQAPVHAPAVLAYV